MGCYNTVMVHCPRCGHQHEFQSKAGSCRFKEADIHSADGADAAAVAEEIGDKSFPCQGENCDASIRVKVHVSVQVYTT